MWRRPSDGCFQIGIRRSILAEGVSRYIRSTQCRVIRFGMDMDMDDPKVDLEGQGQRSNKGHGHKGKI